MLKLSWAAFLFLNFAQLEPVSIIFPTMATYFAFALAGLFTGAAITERVYAWHGMGEYSIDSISQYDINGVTAVVAFSGLCTLTNALLSDVFVTIAVDRKSVV